MTVRRRHLNHNDLRNRNLALIVSTLHANAPLSRAELAARTGINKATVSGVVRELVENGIVIEAPAAMGEAGEVGHPAMPLRINPDAGRVVAAEVRRSGVTAVVTDLPARILWRQQQDSAETTTPAEILSCTRSLLAQATDEAERSGLPVFGVALGLPGLVDIGANRLLCAPETGWGPLDLNPIFPEREGIPFYIGNEAHMSALGESYFGPARRSEALVYLSLGLRLAAGVVINSNVLPGGRGLAGEAGHMSLDPHGERCSCGSRGCWTMTAGMGALFERIQRGLAGGQPSRLVERSRGRLEPLTVAAIAQAAALEDPLALSALAETGRWLGIGLANLVNLVDPETIVLGGALSPVVEFMLPSLNAEMSRRALCWQNRQIEVALARFREDACLIGAVATVFWNILNDVEGARRPFETSARAV